MTNTRKPTLPKDPEGMNDRRAEWAGKAIAAFREATGSDEEDSLGDLLVDLMHWADRHNFDFESAYFRAADCYEEETREAQAHAFDAYEIHGIREIGRGKMRHCEQVADAEAEFWSLFGHIPGQGLECIGDYKTRELAEEMYARITGRNYLRKGA